VAVFAALAEAMKLDADEVRTIRHGALLHEIGKLTIPDAILNKPEKLTHEERDVFREYCYHAYEIVRRSHLSRRRLR
jgi:HD-GYP domain-containing protein (c-di-GMP phosphodiesterase class II)